MSCPRGLSSSVVRLGGLYLIVGGILKLMFATPSDLRSFLVAWGPGDVAITLSVLVSVELGSGALAAIVPRWGWIPLSLILLAFCGALVTQIVEGTTSCGCFGRALTIQPASMLVVDVVVFAVVVFVRPWTIGGSYEARKGGAPLLYVVLGVSVATPWVVAAVSADERSGINEQALFVTLEPWAWIGMELSSTPLATYLSVEQLPRKGRLIFHRTSCEASRQYLRHLAVHGDPDEVYTLIRVPEEDNAWHSVELGDIPNIMAEFELPREPIWVIETPLVMDVEGNVVRGVKRAAMLK